MARLTKPDQPDLIDLAPPSLDMERRGLILFGLELRFQRAYDELSMRDLADELGIRQDVISRIESGRWMPSPEEEVIIREWIATRVDA